MLNSYIAVEFRFLDSPRTFVPLCPKSPNLPNFLIRDSRVDSSSDLYKPSTFSIVLRLSYYCVIVLSSYRPIADPIPDRLIRSTTYVANRQRTMFYS
jgi:hypothetical protein